MSSNYDGTSGITGAIVTGEKLDRTVLWHGTSNPTAGTNDVPTNGLFFNTSSGIIYENTGTLGTPTWVAKSVIGGQAGDQVYPLDTTIGDYAIPTSPVVTSEATVADITDNCSTDNFIDADSAVMGVSGGTLTWNFIRDASNNSTVRDCTSMSDSAFEFRCKVVVNNWTAGTESMNGFIGVSDLTQTSDITALGDSIGLNLFNTYDGIKKFQAVASNGAGVGSTGTVTSDFALAAATGTYYLKIRRTSLTNVTVGIYSDLKYTALLEEKILTITSLYTGLRYIRFSNWNQVASGGAFNGTADDFSLWKTGIIELAPNTVDNNTATSWTSNSEDNPAINFDLGAAKELHAIAININRTLTTETEIQIRASTDTAFTSPEVVRTINISDFTDDTWRFITIPRAITDKRYVQIYGSNTAKVLSINEVKYLTKTVADFEKGSFHKYLDPTSVLANSLDSN